MAYGGWRSSMRAVFILFAFSFFKPQTKRDWRSFGAFSAFLIVPFGEIYGFPLTIEVLSGWLQSRFPVGSPTMPGICWRNCSAGGPIRISGRSTSLACYSSERDSDPSRPAGNPFMQRSGLRSALAAFQADAGELRGYYCPSTILLQRRHRAP